MSCWVVPSIASELWGIALHQVLDQIKSGLIPSRIECGFTVVDVAPNSPRLGSSLPPEARPPTFVAAPAEEPEYEPADGPFDWSRRRQVAAMRRPPLLAAA